MTDRKGAVRDSGRHTSLLLGFVAAAAGIAVMSYLYWWRTRQMRERPASLASVGDILSECHARMRDIQAHLSTLVAD